MKEDLGSTAAAVPIETGPQLLQRLGIDAEKWCAEMVKVGAVIADPAPGGQFHAWMCNAIMYAGDTGYTQKCRELRAANADLLAALEKLRTEHMEFASYFEEEDYSAIAAADAVIAKAEGR